MDRRMGINEIIPGSISDLAEQSHTSIAETFIGAECVIMVDSSGSMDIGDSRGGRTRYDVACDELAQLQANLPGKIAVLSFSNDTVFCPGGIPQPLFGMTNLTGALQFAKVADVPGIRFIVISDGQPDRPAEALKVAATYRNRIDVIYVGPEARPDGREFLKRLAAASGGVTITADRVAGLEENARMLLTATA